MMTRIVAMTALALGLALAGCESGPKTVQMDAPSLKLARSTNEVLVGETTTLFANTANLLGRQVDIRWSTSLGEIQPEQNGRMARFSSNMPGTAVVTAELNVDGRILRDQTNITVNAIPGWQERQRQGAGGGQGQTGTEGEQDTD